MHYRDSQLHSCDLIHEYLLKARWILPGFGLFVQIERLIFARLKLVADHGDKGEDGENSADEGDTADP